MPSLLIHTAPLFQMEVEKDGWVDMLWCQGAQNIVLSKRGLTALKCTVWSQLHVRPRQTDRRTDGRHDNSATIRSMNASRAKNELSTVHNMRQTQTDVNTCKETRGPAMINRPIHNSSNTRCPEKSIMRLLARLIESSCRMPICWGQR